MSEGKSVPTLVNEVARLSASVQQLLSTTVFYRHRAEPLDDRFAAPLADCTTCLNDIKERLQEELRIHNRELTATKHNVQADKVARQQARLARLELLKAPLQGRPMLTKLLIPGDLVHCVQTQPGFANRLYVDIVDDMGSVMIDEFFMDPVGKTNSTTRTTNSRSTNSRSNNSRTTNSRSKNKSLRQLREDVYGRVITNGSDGFAPLSFNRHQSYELDQITNYSRQLLKNGYPEPYDDDDDDDGDDGVRQPSRLYSDSADDYGDNMPPRFGGYFDGGAKEDEKYCLARGPGLTRQDVRTALAAASMSLKDVSRVLEEHQREQMTHERGAADEDDSLIFMHIAQAELALAELSDMVSSSSPKKIFATNAGVWYDFDIGLALQEIMLNWSMIRWTACSIFGTVSQGAMTTVHESANTLMHYVVHAILVHRNRKQAEAEAKAYAEATGLGGGKTKSSKSSNSKKKPNNLKNPNTNARPKNTNTKPSKTMTTKPRKGA
jgi:hypothetical protein